MILFQKRIYRADLQANREWTYVFGDNYERVGLGGQAGEMRGEPNAFGLVTKWHPGMASGDFFYDSEMQDVLALWRPAFEVLKARSYVVLPLDGVGTGLAQLPTRAPKLYIWLTDWTNDLIAAHK